MNSRPVTSLLALALALAGCGDDGAGTASTDAGTSTGASTSTAASTTTDASTTGPTSGEEPTSGTTGAVVPPLGPWRVMTFNVMCAGCTPEGFEDWDARVPHIGDTIRRHAPDLVGVQELFLGEEVAQIEAELPGYTSIWFAKPDAMSLDYADAAIFYRSDEFTEVEHGFYWLSPTPDVPYSTGFSIPQFARMVTWARMKAVAEDHEFLFATTHFDNNSPSQESSAPLVLERTAALATELPVIMVGDFNSRTDDLAYVRLTGGDGGAGPYFADAFALAGQWRSDSNLEPAPAYDPAQRIDHVFVAGAPWQADDWVVDLWGYGPTMHATSDHFAIAVELAVP
ncbi:endonuclease/exonuclease/phosphatase family protein [Nannocystis sp. SCPEA4]|uniref:endonuclease/exonuclease/phosphatase family protein n=1 Tax=Nannocystis sp. SCPEA4 TaxID=2996787 RepID=UPI00226FFFA9|nr:endonuclease/exonuclease/phosphatase family protein [Nannocystis sp. SCPEA4]MCY1057335.1 endonuclease/exonuclease/phosphatase family protein [Nannocystis sp. SCPEA4]